VSHARPLIDALQSLPDCHSITLDKMLGETAVREGRSVPWRWPAS